MFIKGDMALAIAFPPAFFYILYAALYAEFVAAFLRKANLLPSGRIFIPSATLPIGPNTFIPAFIATSEDTAIMSFWNRLFAPNMCLRASCLTTGSLDL